MNDPNKRIDVNLSSLLSLKAELLRKHDEVNKTKSAYSISNFTPKRDHGKAPTTKSSKSAPTEEKTTALSDEDAEMMQKSKRVLEAKSKLYDRMASGGGTLNSDDNCLVMFNHKKQTARRPSTESSEASSASDLGEDSDSDNEWTEFSDCFGRTRKCLKTDLKFYKEKDAELAKTIPPDRQVQPESSTSTRMDPPPPPPPAPSQSWYLDTQGMSGKDLPLRRPDEEPDNDDIMSLISKSSKIEEMRQGWDQKEEENKQRDEIHYSDVMFNEARTHGVGYYAFSTDEAERSKQQTALETEREQTLEAQRKRDEQKAFREKIIAERVRAAKNRQRARLGLPPLAENEVEKAPEVLVDDPEGDKRKRKEEKQRRKKEKEEQKRAEERKNHVRPWDKRKDGVRPTSSGSSSSEDEIEWQYKPEREPMSQEQWNEKKREERVHEFAPVVEQKNPFNRRNTEKASFGAPIRNELDEDARWNERKREERVHQFTPVVEQKKSFKRRNAEVESFGDPIRNELEEDEPIPQDIPQRTRAEVAPPPTFDYYGPSGSKKSNHRAPSNVDLETSIAAGLKFLRDQSDKGVLGNKQTWTAKADY